MPSSYDSSTSSVEIIGTTSPRSANALAMDAATTDSTTNAAPQTRSGFVAEGNISSLRGQRVLDELCKKHDVPEAYIARPAGDRRACTPPPERTVCVYADALEARMRVPLHGFFSELLNHLRLAPSQLAPNGWRILVGFVVLCHDAGVPPSLAVFGYFFSLADSKHRGWYYIRRRNTARTLFTGLPKYIKGWQARFFFLTSPEPWPCPVRWGEPPSKSFLNDPVLTSQEKKSVAKLRDAHGTPVDLRTYLTEDNLPAAFSSSLACAGELPPPPDSVRSTSTRSKGLGTEQSAKKAVPSASRTEKVKPEPSHCGDTPALSGKKRIREEANLNYRSCNSDLNLLPAYHCCSATFLDVPPGFDPIPRHLPKQDVRDVDSTGRGAARKEMEHKLAAAKPSSCKPTLLQTFSCSLAGARELPSPPASVRSTSTLSNGLGTDQLAKKAAPSTYRTEKVKPEPSPGGDTPALSGKKMQRDEANSTDGHSDSDLSSLPANNSSSATCPPVFSPGFNSTHTSKPDIRDVDSTVREAARKEMEHKLGAAKPSNLASSTYESMLLQTVNYASSKALELEKKLAEETAARAELEKKLVAQDAEVVALRRQLKNGKPCFENTEFAAALKQVLESEDQVRRRAEHALEGYQRWKSTHPPRKS